MLNFQEKNDGFSRHLMMHLQYAACGSALFLFTTSCQDFVTLNVPHAGLRQHKKLAKSI